MTSTHSMETGNAQMTALAPNGGHGLAAGPSPAGRPPHPEKSAPPAATIVIPCYNCAETIDETLESIRNQTVKDFEVVCVNDGSTDATPGKLERWRDKGAFTLRILDQPNGGVSRARNHAIDEARGECILFLDADDIYHPRFVECLAAGLQMADVAYCRLDRDLSRIPNADPEAVPFRCHPISVAMEKLLYEMGSYGFYCYAYRKQILERFSIRFDENTKFGEDREFNWKYLCHCQTAAWLDSPLYGYRLSPLSATRRVASWNTDLLKAVKRVEAYLDEWQCPFSGEFKSYMFPRAMWASAKKYAVDKNKQAFDRLRREVDVKTCMMQMTRDKNKWVSVSSWLYLIHPNLYYWLLGLHG